MRVAAVVVAILLASCSNPHHASSPTPITLRLHASSPTPTTLRPPPSTIGRREEQCGGCAPSRVLRGGHVVDRFNACDVPGKHPKTVVTHVVGTLRVVGVRTQALLSGVGVVTARSTSGVAQCVIATGADGHFAIKLKPGTYRLVGLINFDGAIARCMSRGQVAVALRPISSQGPPIETTMDCGTPVGVSSR